MPNPAPGSELGFVASQLTQTRHVVCPALIESSHENGPAGICMNLTLHHTISLQENFQVVQGTLAIYLLSASVNITSFV